MSSVNTTMTSRSNKESSENKSYVNLGFLISFVRIMQMEEFQSKFNYKDITVHAVMEWILDQAKAGNGGEYIGNVFKACRDRIEKDMGKATKMVEMINEPEEETTISEISILTSAHVRQIFRMSWAIYSYGVRDNRIIEIFRLCYEEDKISQRYLVGSAYITNILGSTKASKKYSKSTELGIGVPSNLEVLLYFHSTRIVMRLKKELKISHNTGTRIGFAIQVICRCWARLLQLVKAENLGMLTTLIMPYIIFDRERRMFRVLKSKSEGFSSTNQECTLENVFVTNDQINVSSTAWNRNINMDGAIRHIVDMLFTNIETTLSNLYLYRCTERELLSWRITRQYSFNNTNNTLPAIFSSLPDNVCSILNLDKPQPLPEEEDKNNEMEAVHVPVEKRPVEKRLREDTGEEQSGKRKKITHSGIAITDTGPLNTSIKPGSSVEFSAEAEKAYEVLNIEMVKKFCAFDVGFNELEATSVDNGVQLAENVDLILTAPPKKIKKKDKDESDYDSLMVKEIDEFVDVCHNILKPGGHGVIFCTHIQFHVWFYKLLSKTEEIPDFECDPTGKVKKHEKIFCVEPFPLTFIKETSSTPKYDSQDLRHRNVTEVALHFWRNGLSEEEGFKKIDYSIAPSISSPFPMWTNVLTSVPPLNEEEIVYLKKDIVDTSDKKVQLREDQLSIELLKNLINKFTKKGDLVVDPFSGSYSVLKSCMLLENHRRFIGCDSDLNCLFSTEDQLIEIYARQLLCEKSDINANTKNVRESAQVLVSEMERLKVKSRATAWVVPKGLSPMQNFPSYIVQYVCQYFNDMSLYRTGRSAPMLQWSSLWNQRLNSMNPKILLTVECQNISVSIRKSLIDSPLSGLGVFAERTFRKGDVIGYYYGALVYGDIGKRVSLTKTYGNGILSVNSKNFNTWAIEVSHDFVSTTGDRFSAWVYPAPFCACRYINDARYHESDRSTESERKTNPRSSNVSFQLNKSARLNRDFEQHTVIAVVATRTIAFGEELYMDYGSDYKFEQY